MKPRAAPRFRSEADLVTWFRRQIDAQGWTTYPEAGGADVLCVYRGAPADQDQDQDHEARLRREATRGRRERLSAAGLEPGMQMVVEAKLRPSVELLAQAMRPAAGKTGANLYAALVPAAPREFVTVASRLGVVVFDGDDRPGYDYDAVARREVWREQQLDLRGPSFYAHEWAGPARMAFAAGVPLWRDRTPLSVPDLLVETPAGVPAPRRYSPWKVAAVRLCLLGLERAAAGDVLRSADFSAAGMRPALFVARGWALSVGREGRQHRYQIQEHPGRPDLYYPEVVAAVRSAGAAP